MAASPTLPHKLDTQIGVNLPHGIKEGVEGNHIWCERIIRHDVNKQHKIKIHSNKESLRWPQTNHIQKIPSQSGHTHKE